MPNSVVIDVATVEHQAFERWQTGDGFDERIRPLPGKELHAADILHRREQLDLGLRQRGPVDIDAEIPARSGVA
ncbi:MAG TPA: hypothetical protein VGX76_15570 [Pirellulales bacterium]|jgi:hypothetical protein|nr:hypothetical protein [Pirellulales bacterium]